MSTLDKVVSYTVGTLVVGWLLLGAVIFITCEYIHSQHDCAKVGCVYTP